MNPTEPADERRPLTVDEAADFLRVSKSTVADLRRKGLLPGLRFSERNIRYRYRDLVAFVEAGGVPS